jgi:hypothetical protein
MQATTKIILYNLRIKMNGKPGKNKGDLAKEILFLQNRR